jgi:hypothetical protein
MDNEYKEKQMADWDKISSRGDVEDRRSYGPALGGLGLVGIIITRALGTITWQNGSEW